MSLRFSGDRKFRAIAGEGAMSLIKTRQSAFVFSRMSLSWMAKNQIHALTGGLIGDEDLDNILMDLVKNCVVELMLEPQCFVVPKDFRSYDHIQFNEKELKEKVDLPEETKKEILFLFYYGWSKDYYNVLNIEEPFHATCVDVKSAYELMTEWFSQERYQNAYLGSYEEKLPKVRTLIEKCSILLEPAKRKKYNRIVFGRETLGESKNAAPARSLTVEATEYYQEALLHIAKNNYSSAFEAITKAVGFQPKNQDFIELKQKLADKLQKQQANDLFAILENSNDIYMDDAKLKQTIGDVLHAHRFSVPAYTRISQILVKKELPELAMMFAQKAQAISSDHIPEIDDIIKKSRQIINQREQAVSKKK